MFGNDAWAWLESLLSMRRQDRRMQRTRTVGCILFALLIVTAAIASSAQGGAGEDAVVFLTADRTIECQMLDAKTTAGNVDCAFAKALAGPTTPVTHDLYVHAHRHWLVLYSGHALAGSTRRGFGRPPTQSLSSGQALLIGNFRCSSASAGVTCVSKHSGHGFFLSSTRQRTF